jgi:hypothetical protein
LNTCSELVAGLVAAVDPAGEGWEVLFTDELHPITSTTIEINKLKNLKNLKNLNFWDDRAIIYS